MNTQPHSDPPRRHDIKFIRQEDGTDAAVITFPPGVDHLGVDAPLLVDYFDTVIYSLDNLRSGHWDVPGRETVKDLYNAIMHLECKLAPRLQGIRDALIRAHYAAGGSHEDLALAMDVVRSTAQSRGNKVRQAAPSHWETWARRELDELSRDFPEFDQESRFPHPNPDPETAKPPVMDPESAKAELAEIIHYMHAELDNEHSDRQYIAEQALARLEELRDSI